MQILFDLDFDEYINTKLISKKQNKVGNQRLNTNYKILINKELEEYLLHKYDDSFSIIESIYRTYYNVQDHPKCIYCDNYSSFDFHLKDLFKSYCNNKSCIAKNSKVTKQLKYGNSNYNNRDKSKQTKLERYGSESYNNPIKNKETKILKYGYYYVNSNKCKKSKLEKYNSESYNNPEQISLTKINKSKEEKDLINKKMKLTKLERYGSEIYVNLDKIKQTKLERYGSSSYNNIEQIKNTCLERYNIECIFKREDVIKLTHSQEVIDKQWETFKNNKSYKTSKGENICFDILKTKFDNVLRQYKDKNRYPYFCDFYIPSIDTFIEYNGSQYHHYKPFENTKKDIEELERLKKLANNSKRHLIGKKSQYDNIIDIWTIKDVEKRQCAKDNNLNYIELWSIDDLKKIIDEI